MTHWLKIWPEHFAAVASGDKTFELRQEDTRRFSPGDELVLREIDDPEKRWTPDGVLERDLRRMVPTGREVRVLVTHVLRDTRWLQAGVAALSIRLQPCK